MSNENGFVERRIGKDRRESKRRKINGHKEKVFSNDVAVDIGFKHSVRHAIAGLKFAFKTQRNLRIEIISAIIIAAFSIVFRLNEYEWLLIIGAIFIVIVSEIMNTSIETLVDLVVGEEFKIRAKKAKDVAASVVLVAVIISVIIGIVIFGSKIFLR